MARQLTTTEEEITGNTGILVTDGLQGVLPVRATDTARSSITTLSITTTRWGSDVRRGDVGTLEVG